MIIALAFAISCIINVGQLVREPERGTHRLVETLVITSGVPLADIECILVDDDGGLGTVHVLQLEDGRSGPRNQFLIRYFLQSQVKVKREKSMPIDKERKRVLKHYRVH